MRQFFDERSLDICRDSYGVLKLEVLLWQLRPHEMTPMEWIDVERHGWTGVRSRRTLVFPDFFLVEENISLKGQGSRQDGNFYAHDDYFRKNRRIFEEWQDAQGMPDYGRIRAQVKIECPHLNEMEQQAEFEWRAMHPMGIETIEFIEITYQILRRYYEHIRKSMTDIFPCKNKREDGGFGQKA